MALLERLLAAEVGKSEPSKPPVSLMRTPSPDVKVQVKWFMLLTPLY